MAWSRIPTGTRRAASPANVLTSSIMYSLRTISSPASGASSARRSRGRSARPGRRWSADACAGPACASSSRRCRPPCAPSGRARRRTPCAAVPWTPRRSISSTSASTDRAIARVSHRVQERSPRAGDGRAAPRGACCAHDDSPPIAQQPGAGEHLWFFGGLTTIKAPARDRVHGHRADGPARKRLAAPRPPQRGRVVLRPRGRAHHLGRRRDHVAPAGAFVFGPRDIPHTFIVSSDRRGSCSSPSRATSRASSARWPSLPQRRSSRPAPHAARHGARDEDGRRVRPGDPRPSRHPGLTPKEPT